MTQQASAPQKTQKAWIPVLLIGLRLLLICAIVAGIISFVYSVTKPKADENLRQAKISAISEIFGTSDLTFQIAPENESIYIIHLAGSMSPAYCVEAVAPGFGGDLTLMVGYGADRTIQGVSIVSMSETPGLGARVDDAAYLSQYAGKAGELTLTKDGGNDIDAISGATISSRAVLAAVNNATEQLNDYLAKSIPGGGSGQLPTT